MPFLWAMLAALGGYGVAWIFGFRGCESGALYALASNILLAAAAFGAARRARKSLTLGAVFPVGVVFRTVIAYALLLGATVMVATVVGGSTPDRYIVLAFALFPLTAKGVWGNCVTAFAYATAPVGASVFIAMTALSGAGAPLPWVPVPIAAAAAGWIVTSQTPPAPAAQAPAWRLEGDFLVTLIAVAFVGMTLVEGSYRYDRTPAFVLGLFVPIVGLVVSLVTRWKWFGCKPSFMLGTPNIVIAVWAGQFLPGAGVIAAISCVTSMVVYGSLRSAGRYLRLRQQGRRATTAATT